MTDSPDLPEAPPAPTEAPVPTRSFAEIIESDRIKSAVDRVGFTTPTPVQQAALPGALQGKDLIIQAKTGSGKTLVFVLPMMAVLERHPDDHETVVLVLTPTRELATQICEVVRTLVTDVEPVCIIGGISIGKQKQDMARDRRIIVGTPGRILDLIRQRELNLRTVRLFAVDEVDEMFSMDFTEDVRSILSKVGPSRQGLFVSATVTPRVEMFAKGFLREAEKIIVSSATEDLPPVDHYYVRLPHVVTAKVTALCDIVEMLNPRSAIIFCNTKSDTELVEKYLRRRGFDARLINSDLSQRERDAIVALVKAGKLHLLIGTDIAARGLDIDHIDLVVNYSLSDQHETYVHRSGRTGRAGRTGTAISLLNPGDMPTFMNIKKHLKQEFREYQVPSAEEVLSARVDRVMESLKSLPEETFEKELRLSRSVIERVCGAAEPSADLIQFVAKLLAFASAPKALTEAAKPVEAELSAEAEPERAREHSRREPRREHRGGDSRGGGGDRHRSGGGGRSRRGGGGGGSRGGRR